MSCQKEIPVHIPLETMNVDECARIQKIACHVWRKYKDFTSSKRADINFLPDSQSMWQNLSDFSTICMYSSKAFIEYCTKNSIQLNRLSCKLQKVTLSSYQCSGQKKRSGDAASWLVIHKSMSKDCGSLLEPLIWYDKDVILEGTILNPATINRKLLILILHELGHLILHFNSLYKEENIKSNTQQHLPAIDADPKLEEEAWYFSYCVYAKMLSEHALYNTTTHDHGKHDSTWKYA